MTNLILKSKENVEEFKARNAQMEEKIKDFGICDKNVIDSGVIDKLNEQIFSFNHKIRGDGVKFKIFESRYKMVVTWACKMIRKINPDFEFNDQSLLVLMNILKTLVKQLVRPAETFSKIDLKVFVTENPINIRNKSRTRRTSSKISISQLNFVDSEPSESHFYTVKADKK